MIRRPHSSHSGGPTGRARLQARHKLPAGPGVKLMWGLTFVGVGVSLLWVLWPVFSILFASAAFAYLLDPVIDKYEARGHRRETGIALIFTVTILATVLCVLLLIPTVATQIQELSRNIRPYVDNLSKLIAPAVVFIEAQTGQTAPLELSSLKQELPGYLAQLSPGTRKGMQAVLANLFTSGLGLFSAVVQLALLPIFTFYLLRDWDRLISFIDSLIPARHRTRVKRLARSVDERLGAFVRGQITICAILALLYSVGLTLSGIDLAVGIGLLSGALFIVPYLGTAFGLITASVLCLMKYGIDIHLLYVALTFGISQGIEGSFLTPKIVGDKVGLHPLVVMLALLVGGNLGGIWGMLLAIPITAILNVLGTEWLEMYRTSNVFQDHD